MNEYQGFVLYRSMHPDAPWLLAYPYDVCRWGSLERAFLLKEKALFEKVPAKNPLDPNPDDERYWPRLKTFATEGKAKMFISDSSRGNLCDDNTEIRQIVLMEDGIRFVPLSPKSK